MKTSLRRVAWSIGLLFGLLTVGCTVTGDGVTQEAPAGPRPEDPSHIEDPFPSTTPPMPGPDANPPTPGG